MKSRTGSYKNKVFTTQGHEGTSETKEQGVGTASTEKRSKLAVGQRHLPSVVPHFPAAERERDSPTLPTGHADILSAQKCSYTLRSLAGYQT